MDEHLDKIRHHLRGARYELQQTTTDDPALFAAIEHLEQAVGWLLVVAEERGDQQAPQRSGAISVSSARSEIPGPR